MVTMSFFLNSAALYDCEKPSFLAEFSNFANLWLHFKAITKLKVIYGNVWHDENGGSTF